MNPEAEFLDEIQRKVLRVFLLAIHSHLYSFAYQKENHGLRNQYRNLKSRTSQGYDQKPQRNCTFMNSDLALPCHTAVHFHNKNCDKT